MDYKRKMLKIGEKLNIFEIKEIKFLLSSENLVLNSINNGVEMIRELQRIRKVGPNNFEYLIDLLNILERTDLIQIINSHPHTVFFKMDYEKMFEVGKRLNSTDVEEMKFIFSDLIEASVLENVTNGCEMIRELERFIKVDPKKYEDFIELIKSMERNDLIEILNSQKIQPDKQCDFFRNPLFLTELSKKIGYDWKCLGHFLSLSEIELDAIDYAYDSINMRTYAMLSKYKMWKPEDIIRALINLDRIDLVNEIEQLTNISLDDILVKTSDISIDDISDKSTDSSLAEAVKFSGGNLECDGAKPLDQLQEVLCLPLLHSKINSLYKKGTDKIRVFNANDATIDLGVKDLKEAIQELTKNPNVLKDEKMAEILFNSFIFIGDIYTSTNCSKFQGNIYIDKTAKKYEEAINAYENGFEYSENLHNDFEYGRFLHKLVTILNKPEEFGYNAVLRDQLKYDAYFSKYKSSIRDFYEEGMRCLRKCDFINAVYFFEKEIKNPKTLATQGSSFIHVAMALQFACEKTNEIFQKAVSYYNEAIDIFINKGVTDVAGEVTGCLYYLYKLLSNPASYGFDKNLKDEFGAEETNCLKEKYINDNVFRLLIQAKIYACEKFPWISDKTDLDTDKVLEYCKRALNASHVNLKIKTKIYFLMAYTYSSLMIVKNLDVYLNAIKSCQKALKTFKTGHHRKDQEYAECVVTLSITLAYFPKNKGFQNLTPDNTKPLRDLLERIDISKDYKINNFKEMMDYQYLHFHVSDPSIQKRINALYNVEIVLKNEPKCKDYKNSFLEEKEIVVSTAAKLKEIEKSHHLYYYYSAFQKTFSKSFISANCVSSGLLALHTETGILKTTSFVINLIPFFGNFFATSLNELVQYLKSVEMENSAKHLLSLASHVGEFETMVQDIIVEIIFDNKEKFLLKSFDLKAKAWYEKVNNFCKNVLENTDEAIYVQEFPHDMHKLGHRDAVKVIKKWISNGNIFNGKRGAELLPIEKKKLLKDAVCNEAINCQQSKQFC
ncbi:uncharacterized protein LOC105844450 [Hydra vulgaris]|uniref:uncharacterized protein LOC105844450 n=1 Tax=Hydra vulgaris TaxID=6087 RepID=UPI001F5E9C3D|nr:uncharacterized protein LOC105844450 [Hydra vulgaris]